MGFDDVPKTLAQVLAELQALRREVADLRTGSASGSPTEGPEWLDIPAAAARLGVSEGTIYNLIKRGTLQVYHLQGTACARLKTSDVDATPKAAGKGSSYQAKAEATLHRIRGGK